MHPSAWTLATASMNMVTIAHIHLRKGVCERMCLMGLIFQCLVSTGYPWTIMLVYIFSSIIIRVSFLKYLRTTTGKIPVVLCFWGTQSPWRTLWGGRLETINDKSLRPKYALVSSSFLNRNSRHSWLTICRFNWRRINPASILELAACCPSILWRAKILNSRSYGSSFILMTMFCNYCE